MNTISARLVKYKADLANVGVQVEKENGELKSTYEILKELKPKWDAMTDSEKANFQTKVVGLQQGKIFAAIMLQMAVAEKSYNEALNSTGETMRQNEKYMDSIEAKTAQFKAEMEKLVLGDGGLQDFAKRMVEIGTAILKFANSDIGQLVIKLSGLIATTLLTLKAFTSLKNIIVSSFATNIFTSGISSLIAGEATLTQVTIGLTSAMLANPLFMGTVVVSGVVLLSRWTQTLNKNLQDLRSTLDETTKETEKLQSEYNSLVESSGLDDDSKEKLKNVKELNDETYNELKSQSDLTEGDKVRLDLLKAQIEAKQTLIQQEYDEAEAKRQKIEDDYINKANVPTGGELDISGVRSYDVSTTQGALSFDTENASITQLAEAYNTLKDAKAESLEQDNEIKERKAELILALSQEGLYLLDLKDKGIELTDSDEQRLQLIQNITGELSSGTDTNQQYADSEEDIADGAEDANDKVGELANALKDFNTSIDSIQSAYKTLKSAAEEYNKTGSYSLDTLQALLELNPEYLSMLQSEGGQLKVNEEAIRNKVIAQAEEAKQIIYNTAIEKLNAIASVDSGDATETAGNKHNDAVTGIDNETNALTRNTKAKMQNAAAEALQRGGHASLGEVNKILHETEEQINAIDKAVAGMGSNFESSMGKAASSTKKAGSAAKDLKSKYDTAISYINSKIDEYIDKIKEQKEAALNAIDAQIDALEAQKEAEVSAIEEQISALQKKKEKRLKALSDEMDALKKQQDELKKYYDAQIAQLEKENEAIDKNIKLKQLQDELEKAKSERIKVLKDGEFVYDENSEAITKAQQDLANYQSQLNFEAEKAALEKSRDDAVAILQQKIDALQNEYDKTEELYDKKIAKMEAHQKQVEKQYDEQIKALKAHRKQVEAEYDAEIKKYEDFKKQFTKMVDNYKNEQDRLIAEQLTGISMENDNWLKRLKNLSSFVNKYNSILSQLKTTDAGTSGSLPKVSAHASGIANIGDNEIAVVGDNPNSRELVVGSRLNGMPMQLSKGSGVVNAKSTNTLAGILNNLNPMLNGGNVSQVNNTNSSKSSMSINIENITLPSVSNANEFIDALKGFKTTMYQKAYCNG